MLRLIVSLALASFSLQAADGWLGTWKLDPSQSEFKNTDAMKDLTVVVTRSGGDHTLMFTVTQPDGKVIHQGIKQSDKGGKIIPIGYTPDGYGVLEIPNDHEWDYKYYSNAGKLLSTRYVKLSEDGKSHVADMRGVKDGKDFIEHERMLKQ